MACGSVVLGLMLLTGAALLPYHSAKAAWVKNYGLRKANPTYDDFNNKDYTKSYDFAKGFKSGGFDLTDLKYGMEYGTLNSGFDNEHGLGDGTYNYGKNYGGNYNSHGYGPNYGYGQGGGYGSSTGGSRYGVSRYGENTGNSDQQSGYGASVGTVGTSGRSGPSIVGYGSSKMYDANSYRSPRYDLYNGGFSQRSRSLSPPGYKQAYNPHQTGSDFSTYNYPDHTSKHGQYY